jgi:hypothetical protein
VLPCAVSTAHYQSNNLPFAVTLLLLLFNVAVQLDQLAGGNIKDIPINVAPRHQAHTSLSPMNGTSTPLEGLAAIAAATAVTKSSEFSSPPSRQMILRPPLRPPSWFSALSQATELSMANGALRVADNKNQADLNMAAVYHLLANQQQQQRESSTAQYRLHQHQSSFSSFPCSNHQAAKADGYREWQHLTASSALQHEQKQQQQQQQLLSWLAQQQGNAQFLSQQSEATLAKASAPSNAEAIAKSPVAVSTRPPDHHHHHHLSVLLMQQMQQKLMDQQKIIEALSREVATLSKTATTTRRSDDEHGGNLKNSGHDQLIEMISFPDKVGTTTTKSMNSATDRQVEQLQHDVAVVDFETAAASRQSRLTMINDYPSSHCDQNIQVSSLGVGLNRRRAMSDVSLMTTSVETAAVEEQRKKQTSSSSLSASPAKASTGQPSEKRRTALMISTRKPPKRK